MNKAKLLKATAIALSIVTFSSSVPVMAWSENTSSKEVFVMIEDGYWKFNPQNSYAKSKGYLLIKGPDGKPMKYKEDYYGSDIPVLTMLPYTFDTTLSGGKYTNKSNGEQLTKYVLENKKNVAGKGGANLISSNDWNTKKGKVKDVLESKGYAGDNTGHTYVKNFYGETRYLGYLKNDGSVVDNPYLPNDVENNVNPWEKDWKKFGVRTASGKKHEPTVYNKPQYAHIAEKVFNHFIEHSELGKGLVKKDPSWANWEKWNQYFSIQQDADGLSYQITGFYYQDYIRYQTFTLPKPVIGSTYIMGLEVNPTEAQEEAISRVDFIEGETSTFTRTSGFYQGLRSWGMPQRSIEELKTLEYGGDYTVIGETKYYSIKDNVGTTLKGWTPTYIYTWTNAEGKTVQTKEFSQFNGPLISNATTPTESFGKLIWPQNFIPVELEVMMVLPTNELQKMDDDVIPHDNEATLKFKISAPNDMGIPELELIKDGRPTEYPTPNAEHEVIVDVENLGKKPVKDPTIDIVITDKNDKPFFKETVTIPGIIDPGQKIPVPVTPVIPPNNEITVCAVVNKKHTEAFENIVNENDKRCETFKTIQDMGVSEDIVLKNKKGEVVTEYNSGENHTVIFKPIHIEGSEAVGLDPVNNPKTTIDVEIKDQTGKVIVKETVSSNKVLNPKGFIEIDIPHVNAKTEEITACAIVNKKHTDAGYNIENKNDKACKTWGAVKNYSIRELKVTPPKVYSPGPAVNMPLTFTYTLANEAKGSATDNPLVVLKKDGQEIWKDNVAIKRGDVITKKIEIPQSDSKISKDHVFTIEVNPDRTEKEMKAGADAYADNKKQTSIDFITYHPDRGCLTNRATSNKWKEDIKFKRYYDLWEFDYTCHHDDEDGDCTSDCHDVYDHFYYTKPGNKVVDYNEEYKITEVLVKTKWAKDNNAKYNHIDKDGWARVISTEGKPTGEVKVKAGYPVEFKVVSNYNTNRNEMPSPPSSLFSPQEHCYEKVETFTKVDGDAINQATFIKASLDAKDGKDVNYTNGKYVQMETISDTKNWFDSTAVRMMPKRPSVSGKGGPVAGFYTTKPGKIKVSLMTNEHGGIAKPEFISGTQKTLQDCKSFEIEVLQNNDLGSHITD